MLPAGAPEVLLRTVMASGTRGAPHPPLAAIRDYCPTQIESLPTEVHRLTDAAPYAVWYSDPLVETQRALKARIEAREVQPAPPRSGHT